jgi:superfamily I DNA/RNA helicase
MNKAILEGFLLKLLKLHQPIKAKNLTTILSKEFNKHVDKSDINSALYSMQTSSIAHKNSSNEWSLTSKISSAVVSITTPSVDSGITFTFEQQAIIDLDPCNHLLIRGQAGCGKTTVLAARAGKIISALNKGTVLFLTYNIALCSYVKNSFEKAGFENDIDVRTFHDWAKTTAKDLGVEFVGWVDNKARSKQLINDINQAKKDLGQHRLFELEANSDLLSWWGGEIAWLFGQHVTHLRDYKKIERVGRGTSIRVSTEDKKFIWHVYELYTEWLEETRQEDYDNPAGLILRSLMEEGMDALPEKLRYDHLMIDEVQDFDKSWLLAATKIPRVSISLAGDLAQKIYRRNFTWASVGIQVQGGRSRRLNSSHRTTKQIMQVAERLLINNDIVKESDFTVPSHPLKQGEKVKLILGSKPKEAYDAGYDFIADKFKRMRTTSIVVAMPFNKQLYPAVKALEKRGVNARSVRGNAIGTFTGGVAVTTYHQLKGLEFDHVIIMGLHDEQYPGRRVNDLPEEDQKLELDILSRLLFMVMTRAKQSLTLVGNKPLCRFIEGMPSELFE